MLLTCLEKFRSKCHCGIMQIKTWATYPSIDWLTPRPTAVARKPAAALWDFVYYCPELLSFVLGKCVWPVRLWGMLLLPQRWQYECGHECVRPRVSTSFLCWKVSLPLLSWSNRRVVYLPVALIWSVNYSVVWIQLRLSTCVFHISQYAFNMLSLETWVPCRHHALAWLRFDLSLSIINHLVIQRYIWIPALLFVHATFRLGNKEAWHQCSFLC